MSFLYPAFLFALASLAIPVIIHLFNFRRYKRVQFSNVRFLQDVKERTRSRSRLKHLLTLLMRLLALAFLVFAFAQPYIPSEENTVMKGDKAISIYIDNSFSMEGEEAEGRLLDLAKEQALRIVESYEATDRFQLWTNDPSGTQHRWYTQRQMVERVEEIELAPFTENASSILARQKEAIEERKENGRIFFISDLQRSVTDPGELEANGDPSTYFLPIQPEAEKNLYVDSVWFRTPVRMLDQEEELGIRLANTGEDAVEDIPVELHVNGKRTSIGGFDLPAEGKKDTSLFYTHSDTGIHHASVRISDHPISFDDEFFFSYRVAGSIPVLRILPSEQGFAEGNARDPIASVFEDDPSFRYRSVRIDQIDHSRITDANLILLDRLTEIPSGLGQELRNFLEGGGHVGLIPALGVDPQQAYNPFLNSMQLESFTGVDSLGVRIQSLNTDHHFYRDVFKEIPENMELPETEFHYPMQERVRTQRVTLMQLQNGAPFLTADPYREGRIYLFAAPPEKGASGLIGHALFPTTLLRMAELSQPTQELFRSIGSDRGFQLRGRAVSGESPFHLEAVEGDFSIIPDQERMGNGTRIRLRGRIQEAGNYLLTHEDRPVKGIGINYSRKESELNYYDPEEFQESLDQLGSGYQLIDRRTSRSRADIGTISEGTSLWWYCIILALIFFGLETLILAFPKKLGLER